MKTAVDNKCLSCGANIKFNPTTQKWDCEYCGSSYSVEEFEKVQAKERNIQEDINIDEYTCPNCGAKIITEENTTATHCVYCGSTTIMKNRLQGEFEPDKIIPFKSKKEEATEAFEKFVKTKWFAPKEFRNKQNIEKVSGVYIPFWLYDCHSSGEITATAQRIKSWTSGSYSYTKTDTYSCIRGGNVDYIDVPVDGSTKFDDDIMDSIEPYDYKDFTKFNRSYLSGFLAEKYDMDKEEVYDRAKKRIENTTIDELKSTIKGYNCISVNSSDVQVEQGQVEYALLPVWMLNIKYKDKMYTFAMNGQTKKMVGNVPINPKKLIGFTLGLFTLTTLISIIVNLMLGIL